MPKHDAFSPKAIANRQKSVGLQRLRWYCQMCQKQCRDENGFKCHTASEGHLRQMRLFAENSSSVLDQFSREFEKGYMDTLSRGHGTKRILANRVYQEYIQDKHHTHMNATVWTTLTGFIKHLGKEGKVVVDETEKGWFVQYIDRDPKALARQLAVEERKQADLDDEDRLRKVIEAQVRAAQDRPPVDQEAITHERVEGQTVSISLSAGNAKKRPRPACKAAFGADDDDDDDAADQLVMLSAHKRPAAATQMLMKMSAAAAAAAAAAAVVTAQPPSPAPLPEVVAEERVWLREGIVVKVRSGTAAGRFGMVQAVFDDGAAQLLLLDTPSSSSSSSSDSIVLPQAQKQLQTVVPKVGQRALLLQGRHQGDEADVLRIDKDQFCCSVRLRDSGTELHGVDYDDLSLLYEADGCA